MTDVAAEAPPRPQWLTVKEIAEELNLGIQTIYGLVYSGELEAKKFGAAGSKKPALRVHRASVDAYIERCPPVASLPAAAHRGDAPGP